MALVALLAIQPAAGASAYDEAVAARRSGNSQLAAAILEDLVGKEPRNSDAWVQYGFALKDLGKTTQAKAAFREVLRLAPDYQDARDGLRLLDQADTGPSATLALDAGHDALSFYRRISVEAARYLVPGASLLVEVGYTQAAEVRALFSAAGFVDVRSAKDLAGTERVVIGRYAGDAG